LVNIEQRLELGGAAVSRHRGAAWGNAWGKSRSRQYRPTEARSLSTDGSVTATLRQVQRGAKADCWA